MINQAFPPNAARAKCIDQRMRVELSLSLEHILHSIETQSPQDHPDFSAVLQPAITRLQLEEQISPACFSSYYLLALSLFEGEQDSLSLASDVNQYAQPVEKLHFLSLDNDGFSSEELRQRYINCLDTDPLIDIPFLPPDKDAAQKTQDCIEEALSLMQKTTPDLYAEFHYLVCEIVLASSSKEKKAMRFDGASSYMLWGALVLNVDEQKSVLEMMEALAHESGHSFLFGMTIDEPLVLNNDEELYQSPLRPDPRPMDGIYHATFVSARMHYAMMCALKSNKLLPEQIKECHKLLEQSRKAFNDGLAVINRHAELSRTGANLMKNAQAYMDNLI